MKKNVCFLFLLLLLQATIVTAKEISLSYCYDKVIKNAPKKNIFRLESKITQKRIANLKTQYLPEINLNGSVSYQSEMPKLPIDMPLVKIPDTEKDKYDISIDVKQLIYDGGLIEALSKSENAKNEIFKTNNKLYLYQRKNKVNSMFFAVIFSKEKLKNLAISQKILKLKQEQISSLIKNGIKSKDEMLVFDKEILKLNESIDIEKNNLSNLVLNLSKYIGVSITDSTVFILPKIDLQKNSCQRFEYKLFNDKKNYLESLKSISTSSKMPKFFTSIKGGYGKSALNLFSNDFDFYYLATVGFKWNIYDFKKNYREKEILNIQKKLIDQSKSEFDENLILALQGLQKRILNYKIMVKTDGKLLEITKKIEQKSLVKYKNGIESLTSYLINLDKLFEAKNSKRIHKISLIYSKIIYKTINGEI